MKETGGDSVGTLQHEHSQLGGPPIFSSLAVSRWHDPAPCMWMQRRCCKDEFTVTSIIEICTHF